MSAGAPVLILDGQENALSLLRSLSRRGVRVGLSAPGSCHALHSRHASTRYVVPPGRPRASFWRELLLDGDAPGLRGAVLFPCSDQALEFVAEHHDGLAARYRLDDTTPALRRALLDKSRTLDLARTAGVSAPRHWAVRTPEEVDRIAGECTFPVAIKPVHSHLFQRFFTEKLLVVDGIDELAAGLEKVLAHDLAVIVTEWIPGPDSALNSYYTYIDADGASLFHFTKRIVRRSPPGWGRGSYHVTEWLPETAAVGRRFLEGIDFRGLANVEFKRDPRDGELKIIECNARFTAAQEILVRAGLDIGWLIYRRLTGQTVPITGGYREFVRLWHPTEDFDAFRDLRSEGALGLGEWLRSLGHRQSFAYFRFDDPAPAVRKGWATFKRRVLGRLTSDGERP